MPSDKKKKEPSLLDKMFGSSGGVADKLKRRREAMEAGDLEKARASMTGEKKKKKK